MGGDPKLRSLFAVPVIQFNNVEFGGPLPDDLGKRISFANVRYQVILITYIRFKSRLSFNHMRPGCLRSVQY